MVENHGRIPIQLNAYLQNYHVFFVLQGMLTLTLKMLSHIQSMPWPWSIFETIFVTMHGKGTGIQI